MVAPRAKPAKRALWAIKQAGFGAAVKKFKAYVAEFFGYRKPGILRVRIRVLHKKTAPPKRCCYVMVAPWAKPAKRALWAIKQAGFGAAVKKFKAYVAEFFGYRKPGILRVRIRVLHKKTAPPKQCCYVMVAPRGFEPRQTESESAVLPLHNRAISNVLDYYSILSLVCQ